MNRFSRRRLLLCGAAATAAHVVLSGCSQSAPPVIGLSIDDMRVDRWQKDRDYFVDAAKALGATVKVRSADGNEDRQIEQVMKFVDNKVAVIVIVPLNGRVFKEAVTKAKAAGIKVIAYDRMIFDSDIDGYVAVDNEQIGRLQAQACVNAAPKGKYFLLGGAPTDGNSKVYRDMHLKVLKPYVDRGDIEIVGMEWVADWNPNVALGIVRRAFAAHPDIKAVVASNDGTAGAAVQVLTELKLAGQVAVSGQDADLDACKRVLSGTQTMTVYKHLKDLAGAAAQMAYAMATDGKPEFTGALDNGLKKVNTKLLPPTAITKTNIRTLVDDGMFTAAQLGL